MDLGAVHLHKSISRNVSVTSRSSLKSLKVLETKMRISRFFRLTLSVALVRGLAWLDV